MMDLVEVCMRVENAGRYKAVEFAGEELAVIIPQLPG
jgi:hypothetical protein